MYLFGFVLSYDVRKAAEGTKMVVVTRCIQVNMRKPESCFRMPVII